MIKNRSKLARENAGLSVGQACKLLDVTREELIAIETSDDAFADADNEVRLMCEVYGVRREWLVGDVARRDYKSIDKIDGADKLTFHDRDILAEFAAAMPHSDKTAAERMTICKRSKK